MIRHEIVVPAYGRDYKNAADVVKAWNAGKDFLIRNIHSRWDDKPINREDADNAKLERVEARFAAKTGLVVLVPGPTPGGPWEGRCDEDDE